MCLPIETVSVAARQGNTRRPRNGTGACGRRSTCPVRSAVCGDVTGDLSPCYRYKVGEAFMHLPHRRAIKQLERNQEQVNQELSSLTELAEECEKTMKELKVILYAKFGRAINLDE